MSVNCELITFILFFSFVLHILFQVLPMDFQEQTDQNTGKCQIQRGLCNPCWRVLSGNIIENKDLYALLQIINHTTIT